MGNAESTLAHEFDEADDEQEPFDLSAIEDSRVFIEGPSSPQQQSSPAPNSEMARNKRQPSKKSKSKSKGRDSTTSKEPSPVTDALPEPAIIGGLEELRKREPESFGEYDSSEDEEMPSIEYEEPPRGAFKWDLSAKAADTSDSEEPKNPADRLHTQGDDEKTDLNQRLGSLPQTNGVIAENEAGNQTDGDEYPRVKSTRHPCPYADQYDCSATFGSSKSAKRHAESHKKSFICVVCQKSLARQDSLDAHLARHSSEERDRGEQAVQVFARDGEDVEAVTFDAESEHPQVIDEHANLANPEEESEMSVEPEVKQFLCPLADAHGCDKTYKTKDGANRHALSHTSDLSCPLGCIDSKTGNVMSFSTQGTRKRHLKNKHSPEERATAAVLMLNQEVDDDGADTDLQDARVDDTAEDADLEVHPEPADDSAVEDVALSDHFGVDDPVSEQRDEPVEGETQGDLAGEVETPEPLVEEPRKSPRKRHTPSEVETPESSQDNIALGQDDELEMHHSAPEPEADTPVDVGSTSRKTTAKRKRSDMASTPTTFGSKASGKKKKHRDISPTSPEPTLNRKTKTRPSKQSKTGEISTSIQRRQSSITNFAQPYSEGSELRHPLFNPESSQASRLTSYLVAPTLQPTVIIPVKKRKRDENVDEEQRSSKKRKFPQVPVSVSAKGKERAVSADEASEDEQRVVATSVSRTSIASLPKKPKSTPLKGPPGVVESDRDHGDQKVDDVYVLNQDDEHSDRPALGGKRRVICSVCKRTFKTRNRLDIHLADPKSHRSLLDCEECGEQYFHVGELVKHRKATGHGQTSVDDQNTNGRFSEDEHKTIERWIRGFCLEHDLEPDEFHQLMQASFRRGFEWTCDFMTKKEFVAEFYDVLPHRDTRSMRRYRTTAFDSGNTNEVWSKEEDATIVRLLEELGPHWRKIGRHLNRPAEMCRQRWKNKLQVANMEHGIWTKLEETAFIKAIQDVHEVSSTSSTTFNWGSVSKLIKTRTPQQCANHWRSKYAGTKKGDKWMSLGDAAIPMKMSPLATQSKMEQRLSGKPKSSPRKQIVSEEFVKESDDENYAPVQGDQKKQNDPQEETSSRFIGTKKAIPWAKASQGKRQYPDSESEDDGDDVEEPDLPRNPPADITPGKTLTTSQVFNQTQANTSAKRFTQMEGLQFSQERPSPTIAINHTREQSPELGTPDIDLADAPADEEEEDDDDEEEEEDEAETESETDEEKQNIPQVDGQMDVDIDSDSDSEQGQDMPMTDPAPNGVLVRHTHPNANTETRTSSDSTSTSRTDSDSDSGSEAGNDAVGESDDESDSSPSSTSTSTSPVPQTSNKKLAEISNSFMDNIYASVSKRKRTY